MNSNETQLAALTPEQVQHLVDKELAHYPLGGKPGQELTGVELEYWAALALGYYRPVIVQGEDPYVTYIGPSENPDDRHRFMVLGNQPLIDEIITQQQVNVYPLTDFWVATCDAGGEVVGMYGESRGEAMLRCVVAAHLGKEINPEPTYMSACSMREIYLSDNDHAAMERRFIGKWLKDRENMTPEERAREAEWFANGVEPIPGKPGGWIINRPHSPEYWAEIDRKAETWLAEFERQHPEFSRPEKRD